MSRRTKPWNACDFLLLFGLLASIITLICTCTLVWNPYLLTSSYYWGNCVINSIERNGYKTCSDQTEDHCYPFTPTLPPGWFTTTASNETLNDTSSITSMMTSSDGITTSQTTPSYTITTAEKNTEESSIADVGTTEPTIEETTSEAASGGNLLNELKAVHTRRKRDGPKYCDSFPCVGVRINFANPYGGPILINRLMYNTYSDMMSYPGCSINHCTDDNEENFRAVYDFVEKLVSSHYFYCYADYNDNTKVLYKLNGSYAAAVSSIFWPICGLIAFFFGFLAFRFRGCMKKPAPEAPPSYDASYAARGPGQLAFVGVEEASGFDHQYGEIGAVASAPVQTVEKDPAMLGQEVGSAPYTNAPLPPNPYSPPAYIEVLPDFSASEQASAPGGLNQAQGGYVNSVGIDNSDEQY